ncbi:MAG: LysR family hydrogen peroxide-inducible transcriptional activator [Candidatus Poriferisodalaceae bacterium]
MCELSADHQRERVQATSITTLCQMVGSGLGITLLPASATTIETRTGSGLGVRRLDQPTPGRDVAAIWRTTSAWAPYFDAIIPAARQAMDQIVIAGLAACE